MSDSATQQEEKAYKPGQFLPGHKAAGGRPRGGRRLTLERFDAMLADCRNLDALEKAWQAEFNEDPAGFWRKNVVPLLPKDMVLHHTLEDSEFGQALRKALTAVGEAEREAGDNGGKKPSRMVEI